MTRRRAVLGAAAMFAVAAAALSGCAGSPAVGSSPSRSSSSTSTSSVQLTVFAAASLADAFTTIVERFEAAHPGVRVVVQTGGSSGLAAQLVEGAPADAFAAASDATMKTVADAGLLDGDATVFGTNTLEIAVPPGNPGGVAGLVDLVRPELTVALCDTAVPCGAAAAKAFAAAGVTPSPDTLEQDVIAVLTKVELGEVQAGLVYRTDVLAAGDRVEGIPFPEAAEAPTNYPIGVLAESAHRSAARSFTDYVLGEGRSVLAEAGFGAP
jgi:molybdate transport system substrate-binding protein